MLGLLGIGSVCALGGIGFGRWSAHPHGSHVDRILGRPVRTTSDVRRWDVDPSGIFGVSTDQPVVAISFDDGPDSRFTGHVHQILAQRRIHATFFAIGVSALAHPHLLLDARAAGHSIGNHTRTHPSLDQIPAREAFEQILDGAADLRSIGLAQPEMFRPPRGMIDEVAAAFLDAERYRTVYWSACLEHYLVGRTEREAALALAADTKPGDIILCHDGAGIVSIPQAQRMSRARTVAALPILLDALIDRGFSMVDVPRLLDVGPRRTRRQLRH